MKLQEDDTTSIYRVSRRRSSEWQIQRVYILFGIPASAAASLIVHQIAPDNLRFLCGVIWLPLVSIMSFIYLPRLFDSDRYEWEIREQKLYFRRPRSGSTKISRILRIQCFPLKDLTGYYFLTVWTRLARQKSIILEEKIYPITEMLKILKDEPSE